MLGLQKIFLLVSFFIQMSCNMGLKVEIPWFFMCFFSLTPLRLEYSRGRKTASFLTSPRLKKYKNLHPRSFTNGENFIFILLCFNIINFILYILYVLYSTTFYSLLLPFFALEIFKFKYGKVFVRHSASISKLK